MKKRRSPPSKFSKATLLAALRGTASYTALVAGIGCVVWLSQILNAVPAVNLKPWDLKGIPLVVIDAGHGGHDGGAVAGGTIEKNLALTLALQLRDVLIANGLRVKMTRHDDVFIPLEDRAVIADEAGASAFVSVHLNTSSATDVNGIETYYTEHKALSVQRALQFRLELGGNAVHDHRGKWLAETLQKHVCQSTKATDRGIKQRNYAVVSRTQVPAVLIECGFLTHPEEAARLKQAAYQEKLVAGIATGIMSFLKAQDSSPDRGIQSQSGQAVQAPEASEGTAP